MNATQTEQTSNSQNIAKNLKRWIAYQQMSAEKKRVLPQKLLLPPHSSLTTSVEEQPIQCNNVYEIGLPQLHFKFFCYL